MPASAWMIYYGALHCLSLCLDDRFVQTCKVFWHIDCNQDSRKLNKRTSGFGNNNNSNNVQYIHSNSEEEEQQIARKISSAPYSLLLVKTRSFGKKLTVKTISIFCLSCAKKQMPAGLAVVCRFTADPIHKMMLQCQLLGHILTLSVRTSQVAVPISQSPLYI